MRVRRGLMSTLIFASLATVATLATPMLGQAMPVTKAQPGSDDLARVPVVTRIFRLTDASQQGLARDIRAAVVKVLPRSDQVDIIGTENSLMVTAPPADMEKAAALIAQLDQARTSYRLTYTLTEYDADKRLGSENFSMVVVTGQTANLDAGDRVPDLPAPKYSTVGSRFTSSHAGTDFASTLYEAKGGATLSYRINHSGFVGSGSDANPPVLREALLTGMALLAPHKPLVLGSVSIPGSDRRTEVAVEIEPLP